MQHKQYIQRIHSIDMNLTTKQLKQAYNEVTKNHREPVNTIVRLGGDKEDYQKLYGMIQGWIKV